MQNNQKVIKNIFLALAVIAVIGIAGYSAWSKKADKENITEPLSAQTDTSNWKTYTNDKYGFEIKVPSDWQVTEDEYDDGWISFTSPESVKIRKDLRDEGLDSDMEDIPLSDYNVQISDFKTLEKGGYVFPKDIAQRKKINLDGQTAFQGMENHIYDSILIKKGYFFYKIWLLRVPSIDSQLSDKILSTFKFTK